MSAIQNISENWAGHSFQEVESHIKGYYPKKTIEITWANLKAARDNSTLIPGQWYRITDYVTTVSPYIEEKARSVEHQFDVIVRADAANVLNEDGYAAIHSGDTYFSQSNLAAWQIKYKLDNVNWSKQVGTFMVDADNGYKFQKVGTIVLDGETFFLWRGDSVYQEDWCEYAVSYDENVDSTIYACYDENIEEGTFSEESLGTIESVNVATEVGKGTIVHMKDEFNNECPYDFKNIQFKRWYTNDTKGRDAKDGKYMIADPNNHAQGINYDDLEDYIWAFTFSSNASGDTQTDTSLNGGVQDNVFRKYGESLPNNVIYGYNTYGNTFGINCYYNSIGNDFGYNTIGKSFYGNTIGNSFYGNTIGNEVYNNSIGNSFRYNSIGNSFGANSIGNEVYYNSIGNNFYNNTIGNNFYNNTIGNNFFRNTIGNSCQNIRIQKDYVYYVIIENGNQYIDITSTQTTSVSNILRNFTLAQGCNNTTTRKTISHNSVSDTFKTTYQPTNSQVVSV